MERIREKWDCGDVLKFMEYLDGMENQDKVEWTEKSYQTYKKVLAIKIPELRKIAREISQGNYLEFIDNYFNNMLQDNTFLRNVSVELSLIIGILICKINDFELFKKYLSFYAATTASWVETDIIKLKINYNLINDYFKMACGFLKSRHAYTRRLGIILFFSFLKNKEILPQIFEKIENLYAESEYYVNMAISWLLCECFINYRNETLKFVKNAKISDFVINKFVSKCRDSFRVSGEDKQMLLKLKK